MTTEQQTQSTRDNGREVIFENETMPTPKYKPVKRNYLPRKSGFLRILSDGTVYQITAKGWVKIQKQKGGAK